MIYFDRIKLSLTGVGSNKFRSFLTLLGIIIGVSAVIIMVSLEWYTAGNRWAIRRSGFTSNLFDRELESPI